VTPNLIGIRRFYKVRPQVMRAETRPQR